MLIHRAPDDNTFNFSGLHFSHFEQDSTELAWESSSVFSNAVLAFQLKYSVVLVMQLVQPDETTKPVAIAARADPVKHGIKGQFKQLKKAVKGAID